MGGGFPAFTRDSIIETSSSCLWSCRQVDILHPAILNSLNFQSC
jgi:hypothetical protein